MVSNLIGVAGLEDLEESVLGTALLDLLLLLAVAAVVSLVIRFRRSRGEERQQLKWFTYAGALVPLVALGDVLPVALSNLVFAAEIAFLPVAAGIAILRYRVREIDRLINRTLVYGLLTASRRCLRRHGPGPRPAVWRRRRRAAELGGGRRHPGRSRPVPAGPAPYPADR